MQRLKWVERQFTFGLPKGMLPFYLERLNGTLPRLLVKLGNVDDAVLSHRLDGAWSIKENIGHLADVDEIVLKRVNEIKQGISPMSPAFGELRNEYNNKSIQEVLTTFEQNRNRSIQLYESLDESDLGKSSLHPRLNVQLTPVDLAWFDAEHDDHHLVRINEILSALSKQG